MKTRMPKELKEKWTAALRSGKYQQGRGSLCEDGKYCCLGVLQHVVDGNVERNADGSALGYPTRDWMRAQGVKYFTEHGPDSWNMANIKLRNNTASSHNDSLRHTFPEIADLVDEYVEAY